MTPSPDPSLVDVRTYSSSAPDPRLLEESRLLGDVMQEIGKVIVGQRSMVERLLIGLLADGHVLLEGVPGLAKTLAVRTLAATIAGGFHRIQFTPDLLPSDLIGTMIYNQRSGDFTVQKGPIFTNILLADEINRAPAKVQSALLEAMQEKQVTIGGQTFPLPELFLVLATQNPIEHEGTYPLPEAQVDRFMFKLVVTYPERRDEREVLDRMTAGPEPTARQVLDPERVAPGPPAGAGGVRGRPDQGVRPRSDRGHPPAGRGRSGRARATDRVRRLAPGGHLPHSRRQGPRLHSRAVLRDAGGYQGARSRRAAPPASPDLSGRRRGRRG